MIVEHVLAARARLGECPLWDPARQTLGWVDVYNHRVHRYDPATGRDRFFEADDVVTGLALASGAARSRDATHPSEASRSRDASDPSGDRLLVALRDRLALLDLATGEFEDLRRIEFPYPGTRLNDGMCDPQGRFWVGALSEAPEQAPLYRYDPDGSLHVMETGLTISNGLGFSPDGRTFYLTDSPKRRIYAYRFDGETGAIDDRRVLVDLGDEAVEPDGLAVDRDGSLWSALWDGWCVARFDPEGREVERVALPVQRPTCPSFGGAELTELYVTSASVGLSQSEIEGQLLAGDLFRIRAGVPGIPPSRFAAPPT
jgi:sugar lactone lactonase YvrE